MPSYGELLMELRIAIQRVQALAVELGETLIDNRVLEIQAICKDALFIPGRKPT